MTRIERLLMASASDLRHKGGLLDLQRAFGKSQASIHFIDHHLCHALSAYCMAPFDNTAIIVMDGRGAREATTIWHANDSCLQCLEQYDYPNSLGVFYAGLTQALGFQPLSDEWKVMGLAAYGTPSMDLGELIGHCEHKYWVNGKAFFGCDDHDQSRLKRVLNGVCRSDGEPILQKHKDLASSAQLACERAMLTILRQAVKLTKSRAVCLAGGVALNCKANGELLRSGLIDDLYVQPAAGDDGGCIGAAYAVYLKLGLKVPRVPTRHTYLGPEYSDAQIEELLKTFKLPYERLEHPAVEAAAMLAENKIVGWFQGRMEFGPRALGNRSILANPRFSENCTRVNDAVKFRETWRPFAPSVLHEDGARYFLDYRESPYMLLSFWVTPAAKVEIPAVVHVDGSARVQSVTREANPRFYQLIREFGDRTGVSVVLNTSFNLKGDAIVCTPAEAIETFYTSGLDGLFLGSFAIRKSLMPVRSFQHPQSELSRRAESYENLTQVALVSPS
jgi:carbamoyltransferase